MGLFNRHKEEKRDTNNAESENVKVSNGIGLGWLNLSGVGAMNISTFFRGVNLISGSISQLPIFIKKIDGKGKTNIIKNHPCNLLFKDKDNLVDKVTLLRTIIATVITKGNAYVYIERADDGTPVALRYLENGDVTVTYTKETSTLYYTAPIVSRQKIMPNDMLHFKIFSWDGVTGKSVLAFAKKQADLTNTTNAQSSEFYERGCNNISGVLTVNSPLTEKQRSQILQTWNSTYSSTKAGLAVLQGNMSYQPISINPEEAQLLQSREFNQADICQFLNLNPAQLGLKGYNPYSTFEDANNELLQRTLMPYISMLESEMSRKLLNADEQKNVKVVLDTAAFLRSNKQAEADYYTKLIDAGVLSRNEVRELLGYNKVEGLDDYIIPFTDITQNTINN